MSTLQTGYVYVFCSSNVFFGDLQSSNHTAICRLEQLFPYDLIQCELKCYPSKYYIRTQQPIQKILYIEKNMLIIKTQIRL